MNTKVLSGAIAKAPLSTQELLQRADKYFLIGCAVTGTWVLGPIGAIIVAYAMNQMRQLELSGVAIRPWTVTVIGGLILVDASVNCLAWGLDLLPSHGSMIGRSLWINYGLIADGGYALNYNTTGAGGVAVPGEKAMELALVAMVMPMKMAAAVGFLKMKRWGLQWAIVTNWMYLSFWVAYAMNMSMQFETRFGTSEWGVLGFWLVGGLPFLGPLVLLPFLHTVNRELWSE